jgi:hypothetical protein
MSREPVLLIRFLVALRKTSGTTCIIDPLDHSLDEDIEGDDETKTEDNQS